MVEGGTLSADEVAAHLNVTTQAVDERRERNSLIGLDAGRDGYRDPAWPAGCRSRDCRHPDHHRSCTQNTLSLFEVLLSHRCRGAYGYTERVVRFVWGVTLVCFMLLVGADKLCCPDGCTDRSNGEASTESVPHNGVHTCVLCVGVEAAGAPCSDNPAGVVSSVVPALTPSLPNGMPLSLDHPPRRA